MMRKLSGIFFGLLFLTGLGILCYPTISDQWNTYRQSKLITTYEEAVSVLEPEDGRRPGPLTHSWRRITFTGMCSEREKESWKTLSTGRC